jgi:hypothetical protein
MSGMDARLPSMIAAVLLVIVATACSATSESMPSCDRPTEDIFVLEAQSVPSATRLPCIDDLPTGWSFTGSSVRDLETQIFLDHDRAGPHAVELIMTDGCDTSAAVQVPPDADEVGTRVYNEPRSMQPFTGSRYVVFEGGCIEYRYSFASGAEPTLVIEADQALSTVARSVVAAAVQERLDLTLCGAGSPPCDG